MSDELKRVRKGTKSCTECRRRKVRCTWSSEEALRCRRCEERGSNCVAQIYSLQAATSKRLSSRDRIARLEQQLSNLTHAIREGGTNSQGTPLHPTPVTLPEGASDFEDSDSDSNESGEFGRDPPAYLSTLFENDVISSNTKKHGNYLQKSKAQTELSTAVRHKLQELIPPRGDVEIISGFASRWLSVFHALFPAPTMIKSGEDMVKHYETVTSSTVDPAFLASWVLSIAMTIHQVPKDELGPEHLLKGFRNAPQYSRSVSDAVEDTIMKYDSLLGTIQGIDAAMLFLRLQLSRGNFKKTWLLLRRVIAVAELVGMHRAARRALPPQRPPREGELWPDAAEETLTRKAQVWESLCSVDRIAGMIFNLPPGTRRYNLAQNASIVIDGQVILRDYLSALSEIAMKVQDLEDQELQGDADTELYAAVLKIDSELRMLASVAPASWWSHPASLPDHMLQYWHFYITVRVHLPFILRHDTSEQYSFSRLACMKACSTMAQRYRSVRTLLPKSFFLCRIADLQIFTGLVVLILAYYASTPLEKANLQNQGAPPPSVLIPEVLDFMKTIAQDPVSDFARQALDAIGSLTKLLHSEDPSTNQEDLKIKVPLLGKLQIRRKQHDPESSIQGLSHGQGSTPSDTDQSRASTSLYATSNPLPTPTGSEMFGGTQGSYPWDNLSWSVVDDQNSLFQDVLMSDDFSPSNHWWGDMHQVNYTQ